MVGKIREKGISWDSRRECFQVVYRGVTRRVRGSLGDAIAERQRMVEEGVISPRYAKSLKGVAPGIENKSTGVRGISYNKSNDRYNVFYKGTNKSTKTLEEAVELIKELQSNHL